MVICHIELSVIFRQMGRSTMKNYRLMSVDHQEISLGLGSNESVSVLNGCKIVCHAIVELG